MKTILQLLIRSKFYRGNLIAVFFGLLAQVFFIMGVYSMPFNAGIGFVFVILAQLTLALAVTLFGKYLKEFLNNKE